LALMDVNGQPHVLAASSPQGECCR